MKKAFLLVLVAVIASVVLSACGGGGGAPAVVDATPNIPTVTTSTGTTAKASIYLTDVINDSAPSGNVIAVGDNIKFDMTVGYVSATDYYDVQVFIARSTGANMQDETGAVKLFEVTGGTQGGAIPGKENVVTLVRSGETAINTPTGVVNLTGIDMTKSNTAHLANGSVVPAALLTVIYKACINDKDKVTGQPICTYVNDFVMFE